MRGHARPRAPHRRSLCCSWFRAANACRVTCPTHTGALPSSQVVWGVAHSLHSPLMAVTNAVSGMTAVGGMYVMGGGFFPSDTAQTLGAIATGISAVNITGGFLVTKKMLDMFKRPDDPPEFYEYYGIPAAALVAGYSTTALMGFEQTSATVATLSALGCIGGIAGLASQETARLGLVSGQVREDGDAW